MNDCKMKAMHVGGHLGTLQHAEADANWLPWSMRSPIYTGRTSRTSTLLKSIEEKDENEEDEEGDVDKEEARDEGKDLFGNK